VAKCSSELFFGSQMYRSYGKDDTDIMGVWVQVLRC